jgi:cell division protein FtsQ
VVRVMWDNVPLLRTITNVLFGISLTLVLYGAVRYVLRLPVFPLRAVVLTAAPQHVSTEQLEKVVKRNISGNFFTVDLEQTRQAFEQLVWVRKVSVRRKFPWSLEIEMEEQVPLATWNGREPVNTHGEVFGGIVDQPLPAFSGQPETSAQVMQMYGELNAVLQPLKQQITQISLSPRFAWQIKLDKGMVLELGREEMQQRLTRFVTVYPYSLDRLARPARHVDLRYRNGFAVYVPGKDV